MTDEPRPDEPREAASFEGGGWQRLHPATIVDDALQRIPSVVIGLLLIVTSGGGDAIVEAIQLLVGFAAISPVVVRYLTGRYRLGPDLVQWRMGVLRRVHTDLPRHRIQAVDTRINVVGRLFGLESVVVSSAGGEGEIRIGLIDTPTAERLRARLEPDAQDDGERSHGDEPSAEDAPEALVTELADLGPSDLVRVVAVDVGRVLGMLAFAAASVATFLAIVAGRLGVGSLVFALPFLGGSITLARGVVTEAIGFSSHLRRDRIRVARGILARSRFEAPLARVQGMTIKRSIVARRIGTERISVDTADVSGEGAGGPGGAQTLVHPIAPAGTWRPWASMFLRGDPPAPDRFERVAPVSLRRRWFAVARLALIVWALTAVAAWLAITWVGSEQLVIGIAIAAGLVVPLGVGLVETMRYRRERWALGDDQVAFAGGAVTTALVVIPRIRTQGMEIRANWFQRRLAVADVTADTASPTVVGTGRDLHLADAVDVAGALLASADEGGGV